MNILISVLSINAEDIFNMKLFYAPIDSQMARDTIVLVIDYISVL